MKNKKFDLKSMCIGLIVGAGLFGGVVGASTLVAGNVYLSPFPIVANGKSYTATLPILNYSGSTYVPLKELATLTGTDVTFQNSKIYIENKKQETPKKSIYTTTELELDEGTQKTVPVNLSKYNATSAVVSVSDSCVKLSQSAFNASGNLIITGAVEGKGTVTIKYNTGDIDYVLVTVNAEEEEDEEDIEIEVGSYKNIYIDLDDYDADKATVSITSGSSYITLNKTTFTSDGNLKITGKKDGHAIIRIKFDTNEIEYLYVEVVKADTEEDIEVSVGSNKYIAIDLDDYDADEAEVIVISGNRYITLNKTTFTSDGNLKITGKKEGTAEIEIEYDTGDTEHYYIEVTEETADYDDYDYEDEIMLEVDEYDYI